MSLYVLESFGEKLPYFTKDLKHFVAEFLTFYLLLFNFKNISDLHAAALVSRFCLKKNNFIYLLRLKVYNYTIFICRFFFFAQLSKNCKNVF